jgi:4-diphosphocytidyl-2-C-methyl-D-erythritol kinase
LILHSYAKLNLYLEILNRRKDSYHNIKTLFERISLSDKIILKSRPDKLINIACSNPEVPKDSTNLCFRSAKLLQEKFKVEQGVDIKITKNIPVGAGLGGGSSNAAAVLLGLNKLWKLNISRKKLARLASIIGADVPFFIYDISFALGTARGDKIRPLRNLKKRLLWHILAVPKIKVLTPLIYEKWDKYSGLTRPKYNVNILILGLRKGNFPLETGLLFNSLEAVTAKLYPEVARAKETLIRRGLKSILMSGSGPAVFGIVSSRKEALNIARQLKKMDRSRKIYVTKTI